VGCLWGWSQQTSDDTGSEGKQEAAQEAQLQGNAAGFSYIPRKHSSTKKARLLLQRCENLRTKS